MKLHGSEKELYRLLKADFPDAPACPSALRPQLLSYQLLALYGLASAYNRPGAAILEIGTGCGASAFMLSRAAPKATIVSLTPNEKERAYAADQLEAQGCGNVEVLLAVSWDFFDQHRNRWDFVFVDGDHKHVQRDLVAWKRLRPGGLLLFHDYSPAESVHPCPPVYQALNEFGETLGRPFDASVIDETRTGMVGWRK